MHASHALLCVLGSHLPDAIGRVGSRHLAVQPPHRPAGDGARWRMLLAANQQQPLVPTGLINPMAAGEGVACVAAERNHVDTPARRAAEKCMTAC
jgi:hypothetical protein